MSFIPESHAPLDVAIVYALACALKEITRDISEPDKLISYRYKPYRPRPNTIGDATVRQISRNPIDFDLPDIPHAGQLIENDEFECQQTETGYLSVCEVSPLYDPDGSGDAIGATMWVRDLTPGRTDINHLSSTNLGIYNKIELHPPYRVCFASIPEEDDPSYLGPLPLETSTFEYPISIESAVRAIRQSLSSGDIKSCIVEASTGLIINIPLEFWRTDLSTNVFNDYAPCVFGYDGRVVSGYALVQWQSMAEVFQEHNPPVEIPNNDKYLSPYLRFMIEASNKLALSGEHRLLKKNVVEWLKSNWPSSTLGKPTDVKIDYMATFLRRPEDESGGPHTFRGKER